MKRFFNNKMSHPQQKWGLFVLLTGTLGFTLSMNPEHFNSIARNEMPMHTLDLAATAADAKPANTKIEDEAAAKNTNQARAARSQKQVEPARPTVNQSIKDANDARARENNNREEKTVEKEKAKAEPKEQKAEPQTEPKTDSAKKTVKEDASVPPGEESKKSAQQILVSGSKGSFKATVFEVNQVTFAKFESLSKTEGAECELCKIKAVPLQSSLDKLSDLQTELLALVNGKAEAGKEVSSSDKVAALKKGEMMEIDLDKWAEKCEKVSDDMKLSCHKDRLIELSKMLKNSSETEGLMRDYFVAHLQGELKRSFYGRTVKETSAANCEGQVLYTNGMGRVGCYSDNLEKAGDLADELLSGMRAGNSKLVVQSLTKMRAGSFSAQLRNSQTLAIEGKNEGNLAKFKLGFQGMDPSSQQWMLGQTASSMLDSVEQMQGTSAQKSILETLIENNFQSPVAAMLNQLKSFLSTGSSSSGQSRTLLDFNIPSLADDRGVPSNPNDPNYAPGSPGNIPASIFAARTSAPVRGTGRTPPTASNASANNSINALLNSSSSLFGQQSISSSQGQGTVPSTVSNSRSSRAR